MLAVINVSVSINTKRSFSFLVQISNFWFNFTNRDKCCWLTSRCTNQKPRPLIFKAGILWQSFNNGLKFLPPSHWNSSRCCRRRRRRRRRCRCRRRCRRCRCRSCWYSFQKHFMLVAFFHSLGLFPPKNRKQKLNLLHSLHFCQMQRMAPRHSSKKNFPFVLIFPADFNGQEEALWRSDLELNSS